MSQFTKRMTNPKTTLNVFFCSLTNSLRRFSINWTKTCSLLSAEVSSLLSTCLTEPYIVETFILLFRLAYGHHSQNAMLALVQMVWVSLQCCTTLIRLVALQMACYFNLRGCVHALLIWAYETVPILVEKFGKRQEVSEVPLLRWSCNRARFTFEDVINEEKK